MSLLDTLDPTLAAAIRQQIRHTTWDTPGTMAAKLDPRTVQTPALDLIDSELVRLLDTPDGRLIIHMPPQEGKSTRVARDFPVWALTKNPDLRIVTGSYAQSLANRNGRAVRNAVAAHPDLGINIARDNGAASEWTLDGHEGGVLSVGRGAGVTGRPADLLIIDDPIKDRAEADSLTIRDTCWDWWTDALAARLAPGAPAVLIMTRWHADDLAGRLATQDHGGPWRVLSIPAQCEDPAADPLGREPGEFMTSARGRTRKQWEKRKATAGSRTWAALYQGHPSPPAGNIFSRDAWRWYDRPCWLEDDGGARWVSEGQVIQSWDLAFKGSDHSDWVVGQVWQRDGATLRLLDQARGRWTFTETCRQIQQMTARWPQATAKLVEDKANGPAVIDALGNLVPGLVPVTPQGGKEARANVVQPLVEAGNVHLPSFAPWVTDLVEEAAGFPHAPHDDQVDALTQGLTYLTVTRDAKVSTTFYDIG